MQPEKARRRRRSLPLALLRLLLPVLALVVQSGGVSWAVRDSRKGDALLALTKEKQGAASLRERLEADARSIAHLAVVITIPHHARVDGRPA